MHEFAQAPARLGAGIDDTAAGVEDRALGIGDEVDGGGNRVKVRTINGAQSPDRVSDALTAAIDSALETASPSR